MCARVHVCVCTRTCMHAHSHVYNSLCMLVTCTCTRVTLHPTQDLQLQPHKLKTWLNCPLLDHHLLQTTTPSTSLSSHTERLRTHFPDTRPAHPRIMLSSCVEVNTATCTKALDPEEEAEEGRQACTRQLKAHQSSEPVWVQTSR